MIVELVGLGAVGRRLLSELLSTRSVELVRVRSRRVDVAAAQVGGLARVEVVGEGRRVDADWMAVTTEAGAQRSALRLAADAGIPAVSVCDDPDLVTELLEGWAAPVVVGATFSPGLTDVMAVHAAGLLDEVTELHVARHLSGSRSCAEARARALKREGRDGRELWFFPSPVDGQDTYRADLAEVHTLRAAHPEVARLSARISMNRRERLPVMVGLPPFPSPQKPAGVGAAVVEARGRQGTSTASVVLGVVDRIEAATAALAATCGELLVSGGAERRSCAITAGQVAPSVSMLKVLARRGVTIARFGQLDVD